MIGLQADISWLALSNVDLIGRHDNRWHTQIVPEINTRGWEVIGRLREIVNHSTYDCICSLFEHLHCLKNKTKGTFSTAHSIAVNLLNQGVINAPR